MEIAERRAMKDRRMQEGNMKPRFDPTISLGNIMTALVMCGAIVAAYSSLQATIAVHASEIKQLQEANIRRDAERLVDRQEFRELIRELRDEMKSIKDVLEKRR